MLSAAQLRKIKEGLCQAIDEKRKGYIPIEAFDAKLAMLNEIEAEVKRHLDVCLAVHEDDEELNSLLSYIDPSVSREDAIIAIIKDNLSAAKECLAQYFIPPPFPSTRLKFCFSRSIPIKIEIPDEIKDLLDPICKGTFPTKSLVNKIGIKDKETKDIHEDEPDRSIVDEICLKTCDVLGISREDDPDFPRVSVGFITADFVVKLAAAFVAHPEVKKEPSILDRLIEHYLKTSPFTINSRTHRYFCLQIEKNRKDLISQASNQDQISSPINRLAS